MLSRTSPPPPTLHPPQIPLSLSLSLPPSYCASRGTLQKMVVCAVQQRGLLNLLRFFFFAVTLNEERREWSALLRLHFLTRHIFAGCRKGKRKGNKSLQSRPVHSEISDTNRFSVCTNHTEELSPSSSSAGEGGLGEQPVAADISCSVQFHGCSRSHWLGFWMTGVSLTKTMSLLLGGYPRFPGPADGSQISS